MKGNWNLNHDGKDLKSVIANCNAKDEAILTALFLLIESLFANPKNGEDERDAALRLAYGS